MQYTGKLLNIALATAGQSHALVKRDEDPEAFVVYMPLRFAQELARHMNQNVTVTIEAAAQIEVAPPPAHEEKSPK